MQRANIGEFEELILLLVAILQGEAYGVLVMDELEKQTGRSVNISAVHAALRRLADKGFVKSEWSEATAERGGRRKRLFAITQEGQRVLNKVHETRNRLWNQIPNLGGNLSFGLG
ncbi:MAG: PadR family transcriptional regulator [Bacteroidota bacterium]